MTKRSASRALPSVALRGRSASAWLEPGAIILDQRTVRRRIPLEAVEAALVHGPRGCSVRIVLTAPEGVTATEYQVENRNAAAVAVFASAVSGAVPARGDEPPRNGAELVENLPLPVRKRWSPTGSATGLWLTGVVTVIGLYLAGLVTLIVHGDILGVLLWVLGVKPLVGGSIVLGLSVRAVFTRVILRRRGISALATFRRNQGKERMFEFTDADGLRHLIERDTAARAVSTSPERIAITYDPLRPARAAAVLPGTTWVARTLGVVFLGVPMLLLGLWLIPYQMVDMFLL